MYCVIIWLTPLCHYMSSFGNPAPQNVDVICEQLLILRCIMNDLVYYSKLPTRLFEIFTTYRTHQANYLYFATISYVVPV